MVQAKQIAYDDRDRMLADPDFSDVPVERLISKEYAKARARLVDPKAALPWDKVPSFGSLEGDTVYVAAMDGEGNAASLIQSLYGAFGSWWPAPPASCCRTAAPTSRSIPSIPTGWSPARSRCTR